MRLRRSLLAVTMIAVLLASSILPGQVLGLSTAYAADSTYKVAATGPQNTVSSSVYNSVYESISSPAYGNEADAPKLYGPEDGYAYSPEKLMRLMGQPRDYSHGPFLSAHRGVWGTITEGGQTTVIPENSIAAIDQAAKMKFEMVELDVKQDSTDTLYLMHDYTAGRLWDISAKDQVWDAFNAERSDGYRPQDKQDWVALDEVNPLVKSHNLSGDFYGRTIKAFDKTSGTLGKTSEGAVAVGKFINTDQKVASLKDALTHIGNNYPGMTVVLDLRHLGEVKEAVKVIDQVKDYYGKPASQWVILKPFCNIFKGGRYNAFNLNASAPADNSLAKEIPNYQNYKWIPCVSNRLVEGNKKADPSIIPGNIGPDVSQITSDVLGYVKDWIASNDPAVVTVEIGINASSSQNMKDAYNYLTQKRTNLQSWRPPDISVQEEVKVGNQTLIGMNWKDDSMGYMKIFKERFDGYDVIRRTAGIITVDDTVNILNNLEDKTARAAAQMAASESITEMAQGICLINPKDMYGDGFLTEDEYQGLYKSVERKKILWKLEDMKAVDSKYDGFYRICNVDGGYLTINLDDAYVDLVRSAWTGASAEQQLWRVIKYGDGTAKFVPYLKSNMAMYFEENSDSTQFVKIDEDNNRDDQFFKLEYCSADYFSIICHSEFSPEKYRLIAVAGDEHHSLAFEKLYGYDDSYWKLLTVGFSGYYTLVNTFTGNALAFDGQTRQLKVVQYKYEDTNQWWCFRNVGGSSYKMIPGNSTKQWNIELFNVRMLPENVALKKPASADSTSSSDYAASRGNDGDLDTSWVAGDGDLTHCWKVDLQDLYKIEGTQLIADRYRFNYTVETSSDGVTWSVAVNHPGSEYDGITQTEQFSPVIARYVKVTITRPKDRQYTICIREFRAFGVPANVAALNKPSSADNGKETASKGNDGDLTSLWTTTDYKLNHWWMVDLQSLHKIDGDWIKWGGGRDVIFQYKIEASTNGKDWTLVADKTKNTDGKQVQIDYWNTPTVARYVRVTVTGFSQGNKAGFYEFRVSATPTN